MFCRRCGNQIKDDAVFCPSCGAATTEAPRQPERQAQPQYQYQAQNQAQETKTENPIAVVGFIMSFIIPLVGLICSIIGHNNAKRGAPYGGLALAGIIVSVAIMILYVILFITLYRYFYEIFLYIFFGGWKAG